jgi:hypothetical protein
MDRMNMNNEINKRDSINWQYLRSYEFMRKVVEVPTVILLTVLLSA